MNEFPIKFADNFEIGRYKFDRCSSYIGVFYKFEIFSKFGYTHHRLTLDSGSGSGRVVKMELTISPAPIMTRGKGMRPLPGTQTRTGLHGPLRSGRTRGGSARY
jgi:hypothetical protein